jgi:hypothetical protein
VRRNPTGYYLLIDIDRRDRSGRDGNRLRRSGMTYSHILRPRAVNHQRLDAIALPPFATRLVGAALALAVTTVHVADQGGITNFAAPNWLGWAYRLIEVGGLLVALTLLVAALARLAWAAGVLLGLGPLVGYVASRTVGVPSDPGDVGNWSDWVGTLSLVIEAGIVVLGLGMLWAHFRRGAGGDVGRADGRTARPPAGVTRSRISR